MSVDGVEFVAARHHPAFEGHFPGRPILPGVVMLAEVMGTLTTATGTHATDWKLVSAKFHAPLFPDTRVRIAHTPLASGGVRFEIRAAGTLVASGVLARAGGGGA